MDPLLVEAAVNHPKPSANEQTGTPTRHPKRWGGWLTRISITTFLVGWLLWSTDLLTIANVIRNSSASGFFILCMVGVFDRILMAYKWNLLLRARGIHVRHRDAVRLYFVSSLPGAITPGALGGDAYRVAALRGTGPLNILLSSVVLERLFGIAIIALFALVGLHATLRILVGESTTLTWVMIGLTACSVGVIMLLFSPRTVKSIARQIPWINASSILKRIGSFYDSLAVYRKHPRTLAIFSLLTALEVVVLVVIGYLAVQTLNIRISFLYLLGVVPLLNIVVRLPVSISGIGVAEGGWAYLLHAVGHTTAEGISVALVLRAAELACVFLPAVIFIWYTPSPLYTPTAQR